MSGELDSRSGCITNVFFKGEANRAECSRHDSSANFIKGATSRGFCGFLV